MYCALWSIALLLACSGCSATNAPVQPDFDAGKFAGKWFPIQLVSETLPVAKVNITGKTAVLLPNGDIEMNVQRIIDGECGITTTTFFHSDQPGRFKTQAGNNISIVATDYDTYQACLVETAHGNVLHLDAREPHVSDNVKDTFKTLATSLGFSEDKIFDTPRADACR